MSEETGREESLSRGKKVGFIALVVAVIVLLFLLVLNFTTGEGGNEAEQGSQSGSAVDTSAGKTRKLRVMRSSMSLAHRSMNLKRLRVNFMVSQRCPWASMASTLLWIRCR